MSHSPTPLPSGPAIAPILAPATRQNSCARWLPGLQMLRHYEVAWLRHDLVAGLALTAVLVLGGVAYAVDSCVPAFGGLYATIFGLQAYAVFGPSRVLVLGCFAELKDPVKDKLKRFGLIAPTERAKSPSDHRPGR